MAAHLGLQKVGWIFTDLVPLDRQRGTVKCVRGPDSHFLSAQECIMAGTLQNLYPNPCRLSPTGFFGSKAVTVCVTGNADNQIHMEGYQVSNQCMALVRDDCLLPTRDAPELGYVRETTKQQFVPDVFYKEKDSFGNEVTKMARPLPIEYLLVDVPASTPNEPRFTFNPASDKRPFPIENRFLESETQDLARLSAHLTQFGADVGLAALTDFHLLLFLLSCDVLALAAPDLAPMLRAVRYQDAQLCAQWTQSCDAWRNVRQLAALHGESAALTLCLSLTARCCVSCQRSCRAPGPSRSRVRPAPEPGPRARLRGAAPTVPSRTAVRSPAARCVACPAADASQRLFTEKVVCIKG